MIFDSSDYLRRRGEGYFCYFITIVILSACDQNGLAVLYGSFSLCLWSMDEGADELADDEIMYDEIHASFLREAANDGVIELSDWEVDDLLDSEIFITNLPNSYKVIETYKAIFSSTYLVNNKDLNLDQSSLAAPINKLIFQRDLLQSKLYLDANFNAAYFNVAFFAKTEFIKFKSIVMIQNTYIVDTYIASGLYNTTMQDFFYYWYKHPYDIPYFRYQLLLDNKHSFFTNALSNVSVKLATKDKLDVLYNKSLNDPYKVHAFLDGDSRRAE